MKTKYTKYTKYLLKGLPLGGSDAARLVLEADFAGSAHSYRKGRAILHSIFAYGQRQQWCSRNPVDAIETPQPEEREMVPLTLAQCRRLVEVAKTPPFRDCLPALQLQLGHRDSRLLLTRYLNTPRLRREDSPHFWHLAS